MERNIEAVRDATLQDIKVLPAVAPLATIVIALVPENLALLKRQNQLLLSVPFPLLQ
jgi:hypothetical protein